MLKSFLPALCMTLAAIASSAAADTEYDCVVNQADKAKDGNFNLIIVVNDKTGEVGTWDGYSNNEHNKARHTSQPPVTMKRRSDGSQLFTWESPEVRFASYSSDVDFRAVIDASHGLDWTVNVTAYPPSLHYVGTCEVRKGNFLMPKDWR